MAGLRFGLFFCMLVVCLAKDKKYLLDSFTNPLTGGSLTGGGLTGGGLTGGGLTGGGLTGGLTGGSLPGLTGSGSSGGFFLGGSTNILGSITNYWKNVMGALFNLPGTSGQTNTGLGTLPGLSSGGNPLGGLLTGGGSSGSLPSGGSNLGKYLPYFISYSLCRMLLTPAQIGLSISLIYSPASKQR